MVNVQQFAFGYILTFLGIYLLSFPILYFYSVYTGESETPEIVNYLIETANYSGIQIPESKETSIMYGIFGMVFLIAFAILIMGNLMTFRSF